MKKLAYIISISLILISFISCTGIKTSASGLENEAFLVFTGQPKNYKGGVDVVVDNSISFKAEVTKGTAQRPKGKVYAISTGTHIISVSYNNQVLYQKQVFLGARETKKIELP